MSDHIADVRKKVGHTPTGPVKWTQRELPVVLWDAIKDKGCDEILRAVTEYKRLVEDTKDFAVEVNELKAKNEVLLALVKEAARDGVVHATFFHRAEEAIAKAEAKR